MVRKAEKTSRQAAKAFSDRVPYHHGDLRRELLRIARDELARGGASAVTLSSLARLAGVSQPAPYRHFTDRHALLSSVAETGFAEFNKALAEAAAELAPSAALRAISLAYVRYGERNVELYRLMFASRLVPDARAESRLADAADEAFDRLRGVIRELVPPEAVEQKAVLRWAQLHGLVMLKADGFVTGALSRLLDALDEEPRDRPNL